MKLDANKSIDPQAQLYLYRARTRSETYVEDIVAFLPPCVGTLMDLGCGAGEFALQLAERAEFVVGLDPSPALLATAQARQRELGRTNVAWVLARAEAPPFRAESFDAIVSVNVLRLTPMDAVLQHARQLIQPRGRIVIKDHLRTPEPFGFWAGYLWRMVRTTPSWVRMYGVGSWHNMVRFRLSAAGVAQNKLSESLTAERFRRACAENLPECRVETDAHSAVVWWERST